MPKVLVLHHSPDGATDALADAIAEGAREVKFTEGDVRSLPGAGAPPSRHRALPSAESLGDYDAIVVGGAASDGALPGALVALLAGAGGTGAGALTDRVGAVFAAAARAADAGPAMSAALETLAGLGMILVPAGPGDHGAGPLGVVAGAGPSEAVVAAARAHGRRVAKVAEWVRHAKGHEHGGHGDHHHHH